METNGTQYTQQFFMNLTTALFVYSEQYKAFKAGEISRGMLLGAETVALSYGLSQHDLKAAHEQYSVC